MTPVKYLSVIQHRRTEMFVGVKNKEVKGKTIQEGCWVRDYMDSASFESVGQAVHFCRTKFPQTKPGDFTCRQVAFDAQDNHELVPVGEEVW